jgi:hypothetical protein
VRDREGTRGPCEFTIAKRGLPVKYTQPSFSVPPADLHNGTNRHGQTWDDIWSPSNEKTNEAGIKFRRVPCDCPQQCGYVHWEVASTKAEIEAIKKAAYNRDEVRRLERELEDAAQGQNVFTARKFSKGEIAHIFNAPLDSVPDATGDSTLTDWFGHTCNGTYKTFSAAHCPYCWSEHGR